MKAKGIYLKVIEDDSLFRAVKSVIDIRAPCLFSIHEQSCIGNALMWISYMGNLNG